MFPTSIATLYEPDSTVGIVEITMVRRGQPLCREAIVDNRCCSSRAISRGGRKINFSLIHSEEQRDGARGAHSSGDCPPSCFHPRPDCQRGGSELSFVFIEPPRVQDRIATRQAFPAECFRKLSDIVP